MVALGYLAALFMGVVLGLMGGGGSILTVPVLVYFFSVNVLEATNYSLFIVGVTSLIGGLAYLKKKEVNLKMGWIFAVPSFLGVYISRAYVVPSLPDPVFSLGEVSVSKAIVIMGAFSFIMLAASISMIRSTAMQVSDVAKAQRLKSPMSYLYISLQGLVVGMVTGFVGAGGGFLIVPSLVLLIGLSMRVAIGTSLFIIAANSILGFLVGALSSTQKIDWWLLASILALSIIGLFLGTKISSHLPELKLKKGFGYFVLFMGVIILMDQLRTL